MKLVEILARELKEWPEDSCCIVQDGDGDIKGMGSTYAHIDKDVWQRDIPTDFYEEGFKISDDWSESFVTRAKWVAERARILAEQQPERNPEISEIVEKACEKHSKEDQELWDKVAITLYIERIKLNSPHDGDVDFFECAFSGADAFMAERAKRMKG